MGIALEARQLDKLEETIQASPDIVQTLTYALKVSQTLVINREFRQQVGASLWVLCISAAMAASHTLSIKFKVRQQAVHCCCPQVQPDPGYQSEHASGSRTPVLLAGLLISSRDLYRC